MVLATGSTLHDFCPPGPQMRFEGSLKVVVARNRKVPVQTTGKQTNWKKTKSTGEVVSGFARMNTAWVVFSGSFLHHQHRADEKCGGRRHFREWPLLHLWWLQRKYGRFLVTWQLTRWLSQVFEFRLNCCFFPSFHYWYFYFLFFFPKVCLDGCWPAHPLSCSKRALELWLLICG